MHNAAPLIIITIIATVPVSFLLGKFHERLAWNKLIRRGLIQIPYIAGGQ